MIFNLKGKIDKLLYHRLLVCRSDSMYKSFVHYWEACQYRMYCSSAYFHRCINRQCMSRTHSFVQILAYQDCKIHSQNSHHWLYEDLTHTPHMMRDFHHYITLPIYNIHYVSYHRFKYCNTMHIIYDIQPEGHDRQAVISSFTCVPLGQYVQ